MRIARVEPLTSTRAIRGPFDYRLGGDQQDVEVGSLLRVPFGRSRTVGVVVELSDNSRVQPEQLIEPEAVLPDAVPADLVELARWMAAEYCSTPARALRMVTAPGARRRVRPRKVAPSRGTSSTPDTPHPNLSAGQARALEQVLAALGHPDGERRLLLHGVTGSGKTEVYLRAVEATLAAGRGAIVLVPEIALTPQTVDRFEARFGDTVAVLHSGQRPARRHDEWTRLRTGDARVCVGPRSAVFAPLQEIGLIVVDEEHEGSFKHEGDPGYDARVVAERRAHAHGALLLLGSATPRPETVHRLSRLRLAERIDSRPLPPVTLLDMRGAHRPLHPQTRAALAELRRAGEKGIVLLNRRGWSNFLSCRSCGHVWMCPQCEVALVLHRSGQVACHHCGHRESAPSRCSSCGSTTVARHGAGTERLEYELREALDDGGFEIVRLDADAVGPAGRERALERFRAARCGLLVGTQMVAKGHDFPEVTLGVVLDADQTLRFPDFRCEERTFALITQLAGRAGRGERGGRVLVQTLAPTARPIRYAARHDSDGFIADELQRREALDYPPFASLIRIVCAAVEAPAAQAAATWLAARIEPPQTTVLGPAPLFALRGKARRQLLLKARDRRPAIAAVGEAVDALARERALVRGVSVSVDVDPV
jgi:primosomal protein N' (replication factor Y) (superfamily II helicase)